MASKAASWLNKSALLMLNATLGLFGFCLILFSGCKFGSYKWHKINVFNGRMQFGCETVIPGGTHL